MVDSDGTHRNTFTFFLLGGAFAGLVAGCIVAMVNPVITWWGFGESAPLKAQLAALVPSVSLLVPMFTILGTCGGMACYLVGRRRIGLRYAAIGVVLSLATLAMFAYFVAYASESQIGHRWGQQLSLRDFIACALLALLLVASGFFPIRLAIARYGRGQRKSLYVLSAVVGVATLIPLLGWLLWSP
ncbi:MAG: hypothetical protein ACYTFO_01500 [Planctomycetota bacterium]|jgi:hypothetical protein